MSASNLQTKPNILAPAMPEALYKEAINLFSIPSTSYNEKSISLYVCSILEDLKLKYTFDDYGNIIVVKGESSLYPCFCAHLDTVHLYPNGFRILYQKEKDRTYLFASDTNKKSVGIGGDDKCGIFVCLYLLKNVDNIKVIFFSQEESGGIGSNGIDLDLFKDCKYLCGVDRWNGHDFVNQYSGQRTISKEFTKAIYKLLKKYDYSYAMGLFTDCFNVMERGIDISCFNVSCGYYSHHSVNEYVDLNELYNACLLCSELTDLPDQYKHSFHTRPKFDIESWESGVPYRDWKYNSRQYQFDYQKPVTQALSHVDDKFCKDCGIKLLTFEINAYGAQCTSCHVSEYEYKGSSLNLECEE